MLFVDHGRAQQLQSGDFLSGRALISRQQVLNDRRVACYGRGKQRRHLIRVGRHFSIMTQQKLHYFETTTLGAVMQRRVSFNALSVEISAFVNQIFSYIVVALVAGDHETRVAVSVGDLNVGVVLDEEFNYFEMAVEAGRPQGCAIRLGRRVYISSFAN